MFVSIAIIRGIVSELQRHGISTARAHELLGIEADALYDMRSRVSFAEFDRIVKRAFKATGDAGLGLSMGVHAPEQMLQLLGPLVTSCRTLRQAFGLFEQFLPLLVDGISCNLSEQQELAHFEYNCTIDLDTTSRFAVEYAFLMTFRVAKQFFSDGTNVRITSMHFRHPAPDYQPRYAVFECPVSFSEPYDRIAFARELLDIPQQHADPTVHAGLRELAERMLGELDRPVGLSSRVRDVLRYHAELATIDTAKLARMVGMTPRSLRRRLASEGQSLTMLVDEVRLAMACDALKRHESIKGIAERLGFSEPSAFHRAFRRWTGRTPLEYARELNSESS